MTGSLCGLSHSGWVFESYTIPLATFLLSAACVDQPSTRKKPHKPFKSMVSSSLGLWFVYWGRLFFVCFDICWTDMTIFECMGLLRTQAQVGDFLRSEVCCAVIHALWLLVITAFFSRVQFLCLHYTHCGSHSENL